MRALDTAGIAYALVGGLAVSIYAAPRATEDVERGQSFHRADQIVAREEYIVSLEGLRTLKRLRGSAQDRADLEALGPES